MKVLHSKTQTLSMQQREHHKTEMMRKRRTRTEKDPNWYTLPPSPSHSFSSSTSSSSDFEFTISISPRNSSTADELFYKGQLLPLHPSSSSFPLFPDTATDSSRPSSATEDDNFKNKTTTTTNNYLSFSRFSSVFGKPKTHDPEAVSVKPRMRNSAKDVIRKYLKKVKPLYEKLSQQRMRTERSPKETEGEVSHSFLGYPLQSYASTSCPSSMRSSPSHSSVLSRRGFAVEICYGDTSSTEELQSAIQEAIAHCKNSLIQSKSTMFGNEM